MDKWELEAVIVSQAMEIRSLKATAEYKEEEETKQKNSFFKAIIDRHGEKELEELQTTAQKNCALWRPEQ